MPYLPNKVPAAMLRNVKTNRFHPIIFRPSPAPSSSDEEDVQRYKSAGHHTEGFDTLEEAQVWVKGHEEWHLFDIVWDWDPDEEEIPAIVDWFAASDMSPATPVTAASIGDKGIVQAGDAANGEDGGILRL